MRRRNSPTITALQSAFADAEPRLAALDYPRTEQGQRIRTVLVDNFGQFRRDYEAALAELLAAEKDKDPAAFRTAADKLIALGERPLDPEGVLAAGGLALATRRSRL